MPLPPTSSENHLGPFRLLRKLGHGGMGDVYLAYDPALDRHIAIKILRLSSPDENPTHQKLHATLARRFLREAKSAARISHPNVVTIHTVGQQGDRPFLVMEYIEGGSLAEHLRQHGPMHWREATAAIRDSLLGLAAAHHKAVIHRDIKPANLMRARTPAGDPLIKLADFGLARIVAGPLPSHSDSTDPDLTFPGAFVGSPSYSSPEQIAGATQWGGIDGRADLYSLAATWYALLTGQPPFVEDDPADVMHHHLHDPFPDPRHLAPTIPAALLPLLAKASQKKPAQRYASAAHMLQAIEKLLDLSPELSTPSRAPRKEREKSPRHPAQSPPPTPPMSAHETLHQLESRLAAAKTAHDSSTQIATLRTLHTLYAQLHRRPEATRAYQEALALHIKTHAPTNN